MEPIECRGPRLGGVAVDGAVPFVSSRGARPLAEAVLYRVFKAVVADVEHAYFQKARELAPSLLEGFLVHGEPMALWEWITSIRNSRRRKALVKAMHALNERCEKHQDFGLIKAFVKSELLPYFVGTPDGPRNTGKAYVARLIQAPHDETHLVAGPWLKPLVYKLKRVWSMDNWIFYASVTPEKLDQWLARTCAAVSWFWSDYSAFDATWSDDAWDMVEGFYHIIYPQAPPEYWEVLKSWRSPKGRMRCHKEGITIEYEADVCNASGRDDTALANALLNGIVLALSFSAAISGKLVKELNSSDVHKASQLVDIAIVGDDSLVACKFDCTPLVPAILRGIEGFGLNAEVHSSHSLLDVTFLGMMPYLAGGRYTWGPTIGRRMYKAFWQREAEGNLPAWTRGVAQQLKLCRNVPVLYDLARKVDELLDGKPATPVPFDEDRTWANRTTAAPLYDHQTVEWLAARYADHGLTPALVMEDLQTIQRIERLPAVVHLWTLRAAVCADDL